MNQWQLRTRSISFPGMPVVMGILNVTPDSFSDGGENVDVATAVETAMEMQKDGAGVIDIGGESTRPYSEAVTAEEEFSRVIPVIERLQDRISIPISIDTSKAIVARAAIEAGAEIVNDITGLQGDPEMMKVVVESKTGVCLMHMQGNPQTMQDAPEYDHVVQEVYHYLELRKQACLQAGVALERICLDPGIGFGKTHEHNLQLLRGMKQFLKLKTPILIGHSRKGFIGKQIGDKEADRTAGTIGVSIAVAVAGMHLVRVHDVRETVDAFKLFESCNTER